MLTDVGNRLLGENSTQVSSFEEDVSVSIMEQLLIEELGEDIIIGLYEDNAPELNFLIEKGLLSERTIIRLDKKAKKSRAVTQAVYQIAKEENNKDFRKLVTIWKVRRALENKLFKKYQSRAQQRVRGGKRKLSDKASADLVARLKKFTPMNLGGSITSGLNLDQKSKFGRK